MKARKAKDGNNDGSWVTSFLGRVLAVVVVIVIVGEYVLNPSEEALSLLTSTTFLGWGRVRTINSWERHGAWIW